MLERALKYSLVNDLLQLHHAPCFQSHLFVFFAYTLFTVSEQSIRKVPDLSTPINNINNADYTSGNGTSQNRQILE